MQDRFKSEEQKPEEFQGALPGARAQPRSSNGILAAFKVGPCLYSVYWLSIPLSQ